ncbi:hypothetical protein Tco_0800344, partial [Tanacetum coccineum]
MDELMKQLVKALGIYVRGHGFKVVLNYADVETDNLDVRDRVYAANKCDMEATLHMLDQLEVDVSEETGRSYVSLIRQKFCWGTIFPIGLKRYRDPKEEPIEKEPLLELKEIGYLIACRMLVLSSVERVHEEDIPKTAFRTRSKEFVVYCDASNQELADVRTLMMDEARASRYLVHSGADKTYYDLRDMYGGHVWRRILLPMFPRSSSGYDTNWVIVDRLTKIVVEDLLRGFVGYKSIERDRLMVIEVMVAMDISLCSHFSDNENDVTCGDLEAAFEYPVLFRPTGYSIAYDLKEEQIEEEPLEEPNEE